jgi:nucleotide-binding universal stress UspA family protein
VADEVVVGVDGSESSVAALRWAGGYASRTGARVRAVHVWEYPVIGDFTGMVVLPEKDTLVEGARAVLDNALERAQLPKDVAVESVTLEGPPARTLLDAAADASLLVVGARGRGGFLGLLLGSVATQTVQHARMPVVVVPSGASSG